MTPTETTALNRRVAELAGIELAVDGIGIDGIKYLALWRPTTDAAQALLALERYSNRERAHQFPELYFLPNSQKWSVRMGRKCKTFIGPLAEAICRAMDAAGGEGCI